MKNSVFTSAFLKQKNRLLAILPLMALLSTANLSADQGFREQIISSIDTFFADEAASLETSDQGQLTYKVRGLDPRLRLQTCQAEPMVETLNDNWLRKRAHVRVTCPAPNWSLIVGIELALYRDIIVTRTPIGRNELLESNVEFASRDILGINTGYIDSMESIAGKVTKRPLVMGQIINPHLIKAEVLVPRNALVEVSAQIGGILVTSQGIALENGAFGEYIRVRNKRSKRVIEARVVEANRVEFFL